MPSKTWTKKISSRAKALPVAVLLKGPLGREKDFRLALDTGSPYTIIDVSLAQAIDLTADRALGPSHLMGPTGDDDGYRIVAARMELMGHSLDDVRIRCHNIDDRHEVDGVVGLDIIRRGILKIDLPGEELEFQWA